MKKNSSGAIWGVLLVIAGIFIAGKSLGYFTMNLFFRGWWTLFIIIPNFIAIFGEKKQKKASNIVGLCIGVALLLTSNHLFPFRMLMPLCIAGAFIYMGIKLMRDGKRNENITDKRTQYYTGEDWEDNSYTENNMYESNYNADFSDSAYGDGTTDYTEHNYNNDPNAEYYNDSNAQYNSEQSDTNNSQKYYRNTGYTGNAGRNGKMEGGSGRFACSAVLSGKTLKFDNQLFTDAVFSTVLGGMDLDLRNAIIRDSATIQADVVLGGMDIFVPKNVKVVINCTPVLGGIDDKRKTVSEPNGFMPTIYINGTCVLGGIDVK